MVRGLKQPRGDVGVGGKPGDVLFLRCELVEGRRVAYTGGLPGLRATPRRRGFPRQCPELVKQFHRRAQVPAGFLTAALPA